MVMSSELLLHITEVSKRFSGIQALKKITLSVDKGETVALIGPNGAGKTTLFDIITGNLRADSGSVKFRDKEITKLSLSETARLGMVRVFQTPRVFAGLTVWENVLIGSKLRKGRGGDMTDRVKQLVDSAGLFKERDQVAASLPFGKKRFLELARALAVAPWMLLLDEPASGLSPEEQRKLVAFLHEELSGGNLHLLFIEHRLPLILELASRVAILNNGEKVFEGSVGESVTDNAIRELYTRGGYVPAT
jgi:branched-chain amino acid transport system ATP-binding protein